MAYFCRRFLLYFGLSFDISELDDSHSFRFDLRSDLSRCFLNHCFNSGLDIPIDMLRTWRQLLSASAFGCSPLEIVLLYLLDFAIFLLYSRSTLLTSVAVIVLIVNMLILRLSADSIILLVLVTSARARLPFQLSLKFLLPLVSVSLLMFCMLECSIIRFVVLGTVAQGVWIHIVCLHVVTVEDASLCWVYVCPAIVLNALLAIVATELRIRKLSSRPFLLCKLLCNAIGFRLFLWLPVLQIVGISISFIWCLGRFYLLCNCGLCL